MLWGSEIFGPRSILNSQFGAMGSLGWKPCYWCAWWVYNPYLLDCVDGQPLCDLCFDWCLDGGEPYEPRQAVLHMAHKIRTVLRDVFDGADHVYYVISDFLVAWYEP